MQSRVLVLSLLLATSTLAFWQEGHLLVARIAYDHLVKEDPASLKKANDLLAVYSKYNNTLTYLEGDYPFVECATFADEIKSKGGSWQSGWHFIDTPYLDQGGDVKDYPKFVFDDDNIAKVIPDIADWIKNEGDYENNFVYNNITLNSGSGDIGKSFALRLLIHYVGDIHQPLHATSRVDPKYPKGDAGGNFFTIPEVSGVKNLHSVWDSIIYTGVDSPVMPFNNEAWATLGAKAAELEKQYDNLPVNEYTNIDADHWADESFEISENDVYSGITEK